MFVNCEHCVVQEGVLFDAGMLTWLLKRTCPSAHKHLQHHGVEPLMFATDWLMCLFIRHLPFNTLLRVWDLFFCYGTSSSKADGHRTKNRLHQITAWI